MKVLLGNDVVDLAEPGTRLEELHPRFEARVFTAAERAALAHSPSPHRLRWAFWAAKESAYKALKRAEPETVFSPREFGVDLEPWPAAEGRAAGWVRHRGRTLGLDLRADTDSVHVVAWSGDATSRVLRAVEEAGEDASRAVRWLAVRSIARALDLEPDALRIEGRPPEVRSREHAIEAVLSLSHHGRFVAFACAYPPQ